MNYAYSNAPTTQTAPTAQPLSKEATVKRWAINAAVSVVLVSAVAGVVARVAPNTGSAMMPTPTAIATLAPSAIVAALAWVEPTPTAIMYSSSRSCQLLFDSIRLHKQHGQASGWDSTPANVQNSVAQSCRWGELP